MKNVVLTGIGGQGTVLAAKILAQAAQARGWHVRTAETIAWRSEAGRRDEPCSHGQRRRACCFAARGCGCG